ncbi:MAG: tRNA(fMet)-specific endonuclease VapC [Syntrophomonadaceae bacterium]|nr:tRNA(fMet)-specific endonuclease VapC [Bacillota bacterium]
MAQKRKRVFLDASVFIAAAGSPSGGSSLVLEVCRGQIFSAVTTRKSLLEAQRNIRKKLSEEALLRFLRELAALDPEITSPSTKEELDRCEELIALKDRHVLAGALKSGASFLITLDRKHFQTEVIKQANLPITIMTPKDFLQWVKEKYEVSEEG